MRKKDAIDKDALSRVTQALTQDIDWLDQNKMKKQSFEKYVFVIQSTFFCLKYNCTASWKSAYGDIKPTPK